MFHDKINSLLNKFAIKNKDFVTAETGRNMRIGSKSCWLQGICVNLVTLSRVIVK